MKNFLVAGAVASAFLIAGAASATTTVTFQGYQYALPSDEVLFTDFSSGLPSNASGNATLEVGKTTYSQAPALSATKKVTGQYLAVGYKQTETFAFNSGIYSKGIDQISFYVGSLDAKNDFSFSNGTFYWGTTIASDTGAQASGNQSSSYANGLLTFKFSAPVTSVVLNSQVPSLEVAEIGVARVPEPSSWALMIAGIGMVGGALRARRSRAVAA